MSRARLSRGIGAYALDKLVVAVVQLASVPVLANAWGLSLYGIWAMIMTVPAFLVLGDFGIVNSAAARMIRFASLGEWDAARRTLHTAWLATGAIVTAIVALAAAALWLLPHGAVPTAPGLDDPDSRLTILLLLAYGMLTIMCRLNAAAMRADMHYSASTLYTSATYLIENAVVLAIAWSGAGVLAAAAGLLLARLAVTGGQYLLAAALVPRLRPGIAEARGAEWRALLGPAIAASATGFGTIAYLQGSVILLGSLAGAAAIPAFTAVRTLSRLGVQVATLVSLPVSQEFARAIALDDERRAGKLFAIVLAPSLVLALGSGLGLAIAGQAFIALWTGGAIDADRGLILAMAISSFAAMFWSPLSNLIMAINRQQAFSYANLFASVAGLALIAALAREAGATAAGYSFVLVDAVTLAAVLVFVVRSWLASESFREGIGNGLAELSAPRRLVASLRKGA